MKSFDMYCVGCGETLPINSSLKKLWCDKCAKERKRTQDINNKKQQYYKEKTRNTFQNIKVVLIQSPYFLDNQKQEAYIVVD